MEVQEMQLESLEKSLNKKFEDTQNKLNELNENSASKEEILKIHSSIEEQGDFLKEIQKNIYENKVETYLSDFEEFLTKNIEEIKQIEKTRRGTIQFIPKAVGDLNTSSGGNATGETPYGNQNTIFNGFNFRNDNNLINYSSVGNTSNPSYGYTELYHKDGDYAFLNEGQKKSQIDFKWENRYAKPYKVAAYEVLSTELVQDIKGIISTAKEHLLKKHDLKKAKAIYFGLGTLSSKDPKGATVYGRTFSAGDMANKVSTPNFMDIVNACVTDIYTDQNYVDEMEYSANLCLVSPTDFYLQLVSAKDTRGLPLYPQASLFNSVNISGVSIRPWAKIPNGKIFVGDMKMYNVINYIPFSITFGFIDEQFIKNQFTMLGESRFFAFVKNLDEKAFIYDSLATIETAIKKTKAITGG